MFHFSTFSDGANCSLDKGKKYIFDVSGKQVEESAATCM